MIPIMNDQQSDNSNFPKHSLQINGFRDQDDRLILNPHTTFDRALSDRIGLILPKENELRVHPQYTLNDPCLISTTFQG